MLQYNGSKWVNSTLSMGSSTLASDLDVNLSNLISGQLLKYNGTNWINYTPTYISSCSIGNSTDVTLSSLANNNLLVYNGSNG